MLHSTSHIHSNSHNQSNLNPMVISTNTSSSKATKSDSNADTVGVKVEVKQEPSSDSEEVKVISGHWTCDENECRGTKRGLSASEAPLRPRKKCKRNRWENQPCWKQVKSRSFAKDAKLYLSCSNSNTSEDEEMDEDGPCLSEDDDNELITEFGYGNGMTFTMDKFKQMVDKFSLRWGDCVTICDKEREYWRIVESGEDWVNVYYGSDLDVESHGSGFPLNRDSKDIKIRQRARSLSTCNKRNSSNWTSFIFPSSTNPFPSGSGSFTYMSKSGWNTNNLSNATFLHHLDESVGGVTRPMMYVGMLFSSFCWHTEDNYLYSINYMHTGEPKLWYSVPSSNATIFENAMRNHLPHLFEKNPNLLHLLVTQLSPLHLLKAGVSVKRGLQFPGQFVVTCPRAYHAGFNTGFNCAESVNFALDDWLPFSRQACWFDYRSMRLSVFSHEEFVLKACKAPDSPAIARLLAHELSIIVETEGKLRNALSSTGITILSEPLLHMQNKRIKTNSHDTSKDGYESCSVCGFDCYLSSFVCEGHPEAVSCLLHTDKVLQLFLYPHFSALSEF
eukprot:TRINITY_DN4537_c0_g1_i11.p1 TRINITY_DN4537_c0_g1~~TRINITY_DN4537_c0_g1_i11.p1  ORF type:complete len:560 (-),score=88.72 TRINITY_DN4537_c0_g1_i11:471-2150(-)